MKTNKSNRSFQRFGVSAVVVGAILFSGTQVGAASNDKELGDKLLYTGKNHDHVIELKELLEDNDFLEKKESHEWSNEYNESTAKAVQEFQEKYDLLVDGLTGIQTAAALSGLEKGDEGDLVLALQEDLAELDYYEYNLDGIFGPLTEEALINYQNDEDVEDNEGVAGPYTYSALKDMTSRYNPNIEAPQSEVATSNQENESSSSNEPSSSNESTEENNSNEPSSSNESAESSSSNESTESSSSNESNESNSSNNDAETTMNLEATAYTADCEGCSGITYTGIDLRNDRDKKVVAVDPNVIPLGSIVEVEGYGQAVAGDIGGAIKGNRIDLHVPTKDEAFAFGRQNVEVTIIETP
ncbi:peptidoglycan-binding protein [Salipaludibacillus daqingensis]|uniref:peptidoglycan-binding protein n=1 Tax=Salipaludibacillus daqingensis TaxID=3041001 RepID=UPI00247552C5|nr:peptidoglycan-binding protein [Salipaludibacillus daqingensis]